MQTSEKLRALKELNDTFSFNYDVTLEYEIDVVLKSAQQYSRFDFKEFVRDEIKNNPEKYKKMLEPIIQNREMYREYLAKYEELKNKLSFYLNKRKG